MQSVGPGSYISPLDHAGTHAFAPFFSTDRRTLDAGNPGLANPTPGPGAYAMNALHPRAAAAAVSAASPRRAGPRRAASSPRPTEAASTPGPGSYRVPDGWIKDARRYKPGAPAASAASAAASAARPPPPPPPLLSSPPPPRVGNPSLVTPTRAPRRSNPHAPLVGGRDPSRTLRLAATERAAKHLDEASRFSSSRLSESAPRSASGSAVDVDSSISIDPVDARLAALERIARVEEASTSRAASRAAAIRASLERPDEALIRRRREARRRAKLDQIQDGWRDLLDVPGRNDRGRALDERRAGDGATPGPGAYDLARESREGPRDGASSSRGFGVTSKLGHQETREASPSPGPGAYAGDALRAARGGANRARPGAARREKAERGTFITAERRFYEEARAGSRGEEEKRLERARGAPRASSPPKEAKTKTNVRAAAAKQTHAPFGTSGARFGASGAPLESASEKGTPPANASSPPREKEKERGPPQFAGGGFAHGPSRGGGRDRDRDPSRREATASSVGMMRASRAPAETPAPGAYDAPDPWRRRRGGPGPAATFGNEPRGVFVLGSERPRNALSHREAPNPEGASSGASSRPATPLASRRIATPPRPGPGSYEVAARTREAIPKGRASFRSRSARFKAPEPTPGPGEYAAANPHHGMLKRSFNVTVDAG